MTNEKDKIKSDLERYNLIKKYYEDNPFMLEGKNHNYFYEANKQSFVFERNLSHLEMLENAQEDIR